MNRNRIEWWLPGAGGGGIGEMLVKGTYKLAAKKWITSGEQMYSVVIIVNNTVLYTSKLLKD